MRDNQPKRALQEIYGSVAKAPGSAELRFKLGQILLDRRSRNLEEAVANLLLVTQLMPYYDWGHALFGIAMAERGRAGIAYPSLMQALRLNPNNSGARQKLAQIRPLLKGQEPSPQPPLIQLDYHPNAAPRMLVQGRRNASGQFIPDGIEVVFHENGRLQRFTDYEKGLRHGDELNWDKDGRLLSHRVYQQGIPANNGGGR
jgi:tetratricopeptide (TPR) repeat protein